MFGMLHLKMQSGIFLLMPPSTTRVCPVMNPAPGSAKNMKLRVMSSTVPIRPTGMRAARSVCCGLPFGTMSQKLSVRTGPGATTLPMRLYSAVKLGVSPEINAACTIMIGAVAVVVIAASLLLKREQVSGS